MPKGTSQQPTMIDTTSQPSPVQNTGRVKYADPRDLPSFPSSGLRSDGAAAGAAASLGWSNKKTIEPWKPNTSAASGTAANLGWTNQKTIEPWKPNTSAASGTAANLGWTNQKTVEPWKPDRTSSASAAAALAKNYKMTPAWEPTTTSASARAALLAAGSAGSGSGNKSAIPRTTQNNWGSSAATQAFNSNRSNSMRSGNYTTSPTTEGPKSLAAAKGAMSGTRPRATSTPTTPPAKESYPGESMAASNALSGATLAHRASVKPKPAENAGAVPITTMTRNMFTSHPPVKPEVDEQQNNEKIHATAVAMARKMYLQQQKMAEQAKEAQGSDATDEPKPYVNLQDAAYKQAQERLAKLYDEHQKNRDIQEYYGNSSSPRRRFSLTSKLRRRASSDGDLDDRQQSEKIRQQMSMFSDKLSQVDEKKRQKDRDSVLAAAQRNVKAQLQSMDQKVYNETGMVNPSMKTDWEAKAHQVAQVNHESRNQNKGKIDIGGGKFMDPHEVNTIAAKRVQPVLDDITTKAENERERQAALRLEAEARQAELERSKARDREVKEIHQKLKDQEKQEEKAKRQQEKQEEKAKKEEERAKREEEKALKAEQKRLAKEEKKKAKPESGAVGTTAEHGSNDDASITSDEAHDTQEPVDAPRTTAIDINTENTTEEHKAPESGTSPTSKVKGWIKNRFSRGKSVGDNEKPADKGKGFVGGAALRDSELNRSNTSLSNRPTSMRDVALAGKSGEAETHDEEALRDSRGVSPVSSEDEEQTERTEMQGEFPALTPPRPIEDPMIRTSSSPTRDSRFRENLDS